MKQERISGLTEDEIMNARQQIIFDAERDHRRIQDNAFPRNEKEEERLRNKIRLMSHSSLHDYFDNSILIPWMLKETSREKIRDLLIGGYHVQ